MKSETTWALVSQGGGDGEEDRVVAKFTTQLFRMCTSKEKKLELSLFSRQTVGIGEEF